MLVRNAFRLIILLLAGLAFYLPTHAQNSQQAGLVIHFGEQNTSTLCIELGESNLTGFDVLSKSPYKVIADHTAQGAAVCQIEQTGCPVDQCFCDSPPHYWSYWHLIDGEWAYASAGASTAIILPGSVDGWAWSNGTPPPKYTFEQICQAQSHSVEAAPAVSEDALAERTTPAQSANFWLFGVLVVGLGFGLVWMISRR